nr:retrovirus-related Pol polyprotein from transposon TNT 1-94 [Tanacetum cinerariifolium]
MALGYQNPFYLKQAQQKQQSLYDGKLLFEKHDPPIVHDSEEALQLAQESKALELEIERLLRAVVSQDIMFVVQNNSVGETSNLQTELERTKERFENCIIKKENEYAKLWNDWYKQCKECKFDKSSYDKAYNDMQQKIERLQAQLGDLKGKSCSKHMTENLKLLINFVWKFLGTVRFRNDHIAAIMGFGDLQWGNILITRVYFVEGLGHNLFSVVIVDDYSRYTWVHFHGSKDEAPEVIKTFLKRITVLLQSPVIIIRTDNDTEFKNQVLKEYFDSVGISHQVSSIRTPQQNGVVEQRIVEATRTMLIFSRASLFVWAEAIATACFTQNRSIIHRRFNRTPYELINGKKLDIFFLHVFGALCYPKNDREDIGKLGAKGDIGFFIGYSADSCAFRVYNRWTKKIIETMNVSFDELSAMAFEQRSSKLGLQSITSGQIIADTAPTPTNSSSQATIFPNTSQDVEGLNSQQQHAQHQEYRAPIQPETVADNVPNAMFDANTFVNPFATPSTSAAESSSLQYVDPSNMHTFYQPYPHEF